MKKIFGFTLAEVLITLGIIGVIAALTIPILMKHYQQQAVLSQLKKAYSEFNQALKMAEVDYGSPEQWKAILLNCEDASQCFYDDFLKSHLKIAKFCQFENLENCFDVNIKRLNGGNYFNSLNSHGALSFTTVSGYSVLYWVSGSRNSSSIHIDVNGPKQGPNIIGKDVFLFGLFFADEYSKAGGMYPMGYYNISDHNRDEIKNNTYLGCVKNGKSSGSYCSGLIFVDGWKFASDYPW